MFNGDTNTSVKVNSLKKFKDTKFIWILIWFVMWVINYEIFWGFFVSCFEMYK